jgi:hypothetical protein
MKSEDQVADLRKNASHSIQNSLEKQDLPGFVPQVRYPPAMIFLPSWDSSHIPGSLDPVASPAEAGDCPWPTGHLPWQRHMSRTYIRVYDAHRRQHFVPVGWWCPDCHAFMDDLR